MRRRGGAAADGITNKGSKKRKKKRVLSDRTVSSLIIQRGSEKAEVERQKGERAPSLIKNRLCKRI